MASGLPIIASNIGPNKELGKKKEIIYFNPDSSKELAEKLSELLASNGKREMLGKNARKTAERLYSWHEIAKKNFELYKEIIRQN